MILASIRKPELRDGSLCLVSQDRRWLYPCPHIAKNMQTLMDNWQALAPELAALSSQIAEDGTLLAKLSADQVIFESPLPRAYQWLDGSAYLNHVMLVRKARNADMPPEFWTNPLMYQGGSDSFLGPNDDILVADEAFGIDYEAEIAVVVDDVPMGISADKAHQHIKLIMLVNDVSLRNLIPEELAKGFGFLQSKPSSAFSPFALSPEELGSHWRDGKLHLPLCSYLNGECLGKPNAGVEMNFNFAELIAHAAKTRPLAAGSIIGSGTVSNSDKDSGVSCLAELRMEEIIATGKPSTRFMHFGDTIRIDMQDQHGINLFGSIEQTVKAY